MHTQTHARTCIQNGSQKKRENREENVKKK